MRKIFSILFALVLVLSFSLVTAVPAVAAELEVGLGKTYTTIQAAITAANPGDTIIVAVGIYTEAVTVDKAGLTIKSSGGASATTWTTSTPSSGPVTIKANNVMIDGFTLSGHTAVDNKGAITIDDTGGKITGGTISNNKITGNRWGIRVGISSGGVDGVTIKDNGITYNDGKGIVFWNAPDFAPQAISNITISGNTITNNGDSAISTYGPGPNTIINNIITNNTGNGISIKYDTGDIVRGNTVTNNGAMGINMHQVTNCVVENNIVSGHLSEAVVTNFWGGAPVTAGKGSGIYVHEASTGNTIRYNTITGNRNGVLVNREAAGADDPSGNIITLNNIAGNTYYGLITTCPPEVAAENNWWGNASGPYHASNPTGIGNGVSGNVDFTPWLSAVTVGGSVSLTLDNPQIIAISVSPTSIDFGTLYPGQSSSVTTLTISNIGTVNAKVTTSITGTGAAFFTANLYLDHPVKAIDYDISLTVGGSPATPGAQVVVPPTPAVGTVTGTLVFWAVMAPPAPP